VKTNPIYRIYIFFVILILLLFSENLYPGDKFQISLDHAQFLGSDNQCYLEIYYSYPENGPLYQKKDNNEFGCEVYFSLNILQDDSLWANKHWKIEKQLTDTTILSNSKKHLVDLIRYPVNGGHQYTIQLFARDYYSGKMDSAKTILTGRNFVETQVCLSDLLIASSVQPFSPASDPKFRKKAYEIVPNPNLAFGIDLYELFYYFEIYHLTQARPDSQYAILWQIQDSLGQLVATNANSLEWRPIVHESSREIGQIGVWGLENGSYTLSCYVQTASGKISESASSKKFFIYKPVTPVPAVNTVTLVEQPTFLEGFDEQQLDREFDQMFALTTKDIRKIYDNIKSLDQKKSQIYNLWTMSASLVGLPVTDFRYKFMQRIKEADEKYKSSFKPGWKTDQGIVFLKYGPPTDVERHPSEAGTKPYEVWRYENLEGGVIFVFIDRTGFSQYELIHSTKRGELSDQNWQRYISTNPLDRYE
jgi:GWxTD domain-containing protein